MGEQRLDVLARFLTDPSSRRSLLRALAAVLSGGLAVPSVGAARSRQDDRAAAAAEAARELSRLESAHAFDALYDLLHPDAQAVVPREAVVGWYGEYMAGRQTAELTVTAVRFVSWTWPVTGVTYPETAEVDYVQPFWVGGVRTDVADTVRLVEAEGTWRWFFGRSREFIEEQIARFADGSAPSTGAESAGPTLRVELTVAGTPPAGTVFALDLQAPDAAPLVCEELSDSDGDGVYLSANLANPAWPPGTEGTAFYGGTLLYGSDFQGSAAPGVVRSSAGPSACFGGASTVIQRFDSQEVTEDTILRATVSFEEPVVQPGPTRRYAITDLGSLGGASQAYDVNNAGQVVGVTATDLVSVLPDYGVSRAFLWTDGELIDLGTLNPEAEGSAAFGLNDAGQVVGSADSIAPGAAPGPLPHAFLWDGGSMVDLGTLAGSASHAEAINARGQIVGLSRMAGGGGPIHAFLSDGSAMTDLGTLGGEDSQASDINDDGWIVGSAATADGTSRAALWRQGAVTDLGVLPGDSRSVANAINRRGHAVGVSSGEVSGPDYPRRAVLWRDGEVLDLGSLPDRPIAEALDINGAGEIVGWAGAGSGYDDDARAVLFQDGRVLDLNSLIASVSGWILNEARAINDAGQIVGTGTIDGQTRAFLLTPAGGTGSPAATEGEGPRITAEPTVGEIASTTAVVSWTTDQPTVGTVEYGRTERFGRTRSSQPGDPTAEHRVELDNLDPGQTYHYRVRSSNDAGEAVSEVFTFRTPAQAADVPMFRGNPARTGAMPGPGPDPADGIDLLWAFDTEGTGVSSPAVVGGVAYFCSGYHLYAVDAATGDERWRFRAEDAVYSSPTVVDGLVYFGSTVGGFGGNLYAVDAVTGEERWRFAAVSFVNSSPAVVDGVVYFGSVGYGGRSFYALDAATGEERWRSGIGAVSSPAVVDGVVYVSEDGKYLVALDAATGAERWQFATGGGPSSPAVAEGVIYVGSEEDGHLYAVDAATGEERWRFPAGDYFTSSPAVADGVVYVGSQDGNLYAVDAATGEERWRFAGGGGSSPAVVDGVVYVGGGDNLYAVDAATGEERWRFAGGGGSSPVVVGGLVYVGGGDGTLYAVE